MDRKIVFVIFGMLISFGVFAGGVSAGSETNFYDSGGNSLGTEKSITFTSAGSDTSVYLRVPKNASVINGTMNVSGYPTVPWQSDSAIASGLGSIGSRSNPTVFQKDGTWYLISGEEEGGFYGFIWTGSTWQPDSAIKSGLGAVGRWSAPTVFQKDGTWYLISGEYDGIFNGFNWTGSTWQPDSAIASGLGDIEYCSDPTVFQKDGTWYLISGECAGVFTGFIWTGSTWQPDSAIASGLGDIGYFSAPTVFQKDGTWYLIAGKWGGGFNGFSWTGSTWQPDSAIASGLGDIGFRSNPTVFQKDGTWYLISGEDAGVFTGFSMSLFPSNLSIDIANDSIIDWSMTGELNSTNSPMRVDDLNTTTINDYISIHSADVDGFILVPLNISSDSAGIVQLDSLNLVWTNPNPLRPAFASPTPSDNSYVNTVSVTINATAYSGGEHINVDSCLLEWQGANESMTKGSSAPSTYCYKTMSGLTDGTTYTYKVWVNNTDNLWNVSETRQFTVDTTPPTITITSPQNTAYELGTGIVIVYDSNEAIVEPDYYSLDGGDNTTFLNSTTAIIPSIGSHDITIWAKDTSGNWGSDTEYFMVQDTTSPTVTFVPPTEPDGAVITDKNYAFVNVTLSETPDTILLEWNGVNETMLGSGLNWYLNKTTLANGDYTYKVWANDSLGTMGISETRSITIDMPTFTHHLYPGWNLIGYVGIDGAEIGFVLSSVDYSTLWRWNATAGTWEMYTNGVGGEFETLERGRGYWIKVNAETDWSYQV